MKTAYGVSRARAALVQAGNDFTDGIEGKDLLGEAPLAFRNAVYGLLRIGGNIVPSIVNLVDGQEYDVVARKTKYHGTANAVTKVVTAVKQGHPFEAASAVLIEGTDGFVDDGVHALTGAANSLIVPAGTANLQRNHIKRLLSAKPSKN
ncbi:MAG: hypothetical protein Q7R81_04630 [Candidatus Peregrinibacteria bacterium]|nr:hypothetical protein [Candidatus Peregrinibacteria bacterium]